MIINKFLRIGRVVGLLLFFFSNSILYYSCENDEVDPVVEDVDEEDEWPGSDYSIPSYDDDYSSIASWENRSLWNLANVHDPSVAKYGNYYYMYGTDASYGNAHEGHGHYTYRRSDDLVNWSFKGMSIASDPEWITDSLNSIRLSYGLASIENPTLGYWAPVVREYDGNYRMYYSVVVDNYIGNGAENTTDNFDNTWTERAFIGLRTSSSLSTNTWEDKGMIICSTSDKGTDWSRSSTNDYDAYFKYNAIDPSYIITPEGEHWLIYGSWHSGIVALELDPDTGMPLEDFDYEDESTWGTCIYTRDTSSRWQASEGPEIVYNEETGYYYMFLAYDELSVAYNTRVCRAESITGPYYDYYGNNVTSNGGDVFPIVTHPYQFNDHAGWVGISHCGVFQNEDSGEWFFTSQGRLPANYNGNAYSNALMMGQVRKMVWTEDGWPVVMPERYTGVPEKTITEDELVGTWENITLNYEYQTMQTSVSLVLSSDYSATGALSGTWSFDADSNVLTIGDTELCIEREVDWEADPRVLTIVYSGINSNGKTLWGKRVSD